jgi:acetyltransferase-like isoleucine patch superfamily enzyme
VSTLYLCGAGNAEGVRLAQRVNAATGRWERLVLLDDLPAKHGAALLGVPVVGAIDELHEAGPGAEAVNLVARTTAGRAAVRQRILASGVPLASLVHPGVDASECDVAPGALVYEQAILSTATRLGRDSVVFMRAVVGHDASVGEGCVVASGAVLNARVALEDGVYVGSNASVLPDVRIGTRTTVAANTLVATSVPSDVTVIGVPGQIVAGAESKAPASRGYASNAGDLAQTMKLEQTLLEVLRSVLRNPSAGPTDRFFEIGGTSLLALEFIAAVGRQTGHQVPLVEFFARCTVRELARQLLGHDSPDPRQTPSPRAGMLGLLAARRAANPG